MKYLKNLPNHDAYEAFINGNQYKEIQQEKNEAISYCQAEKHVHYNPYIPPAPKILDILYSDNNGNLSYTSEVLPITDGKTPIALCIAGQDFFGENEKARWMSLKYMNYETPTIGSLTAQGIVYGGYNVDISTIDNISYTYKDINQNWGYLTADWITKDNNKIPSLFDENNNWNISALGEINQYAVTDIDGKNKTSKILTMATAQSNWQTAETIANEKDSGYAPAACCCWKYYTLGTQQGDWYLPAGGEISMIVVQKPEINVKLNAIATIYSNNCINAISNSTYLTSTEISQFGLFRAGIDLGGISYSGKADNNYVIALLQY